MRRHALRDDAPGAYHRALPDGDASQNHASRSDRGAILDHRLEVLRRVLLRSRVFVIDERDIGSDEHVIAHDGAVP